MRCLFVTLFVCTLSIGSMYGQAVNGTLLGTILDSSGAAVPGAQVTSTETNTGLNRKTATSEAGTYVFSDLPPGVYSVSAERPGFRKEVRTGVSVQVNETARIDFTLEPGNVSETVTITAEAGL